MASASPTQFAFTASKKAPEVVTDRKGNKEYVLGKFLGKGAFAKCYELVDRETNTIFAGKVVPKALLRKASYKQKMVQEIEIHRSLSHKHIVGFQGYFEDSKNVYIIMELCNRWSLTEMIRRRKVLTEPEARYFLYQMLLACQYLVEQRVIHRDLKLSNLLLNENMELKVGDFGLATRLDHVGELRKTVCGTPNYIAPEVLAKKGHSFEADVWSVGCILFTLLMGQPPFESSTLKETYSRIQKNQFSVPSTVSQPACALIRRMLQPEPQNRPSIEDIMRDDFMTCGYLPSLLPESCLVTEPRFDTLKANSPVGRKRTIQGRNEGREAINSAISNHQEKKPKLMESIPTKQTNAGEDPSTAPAAAFASPAQRRGQQEAHLKELRRLLRHLCSTHPPERRFECPDEVEDPASVPVFWISKWVDFTEKYGLCYELSDKSVGVLFNDNTRIMRLNNNMSVTYVDEAGLEHYHTLEDYPVKLHKKITLLKYFCTYMKQHLLALGEAVRPRQCDNLVRLPCLGAWLRTRCAISFYLTDGTVQMNFFHDHTKIMLCPLMAAVSYVDSDRAFHTYRIATLKHGCPPKLFSRLKYALSILEKLSSTSS